MTPKQGIQRRIVEIGDTLVELSRKIHAHPELGFEEFRASAWLASALERAGFEVELDVFGMPTAFTAHAGKGSLHLALCAEYDALPEIGHACGHNLIAAIALGAACGIRGMLDGLGVQLTVLGTPAEELGNGKALLLERGAFEGIHAALMAHPAPIDVLEPPLLAFAQFDVDYRGRERDPFGLGDSGTTAADARTLAQVAIGMLRASLRSTDRVHGVLTQASQTSAQDFSRAAATYMVRARTLAELLPLRQRVLRCFEAGALALGAELEVREAHEPTVICGTTVSSPRSIGATLAPWAARFRSSALCSRAARGRRTWETSRNGFQRSIPRSASTRSQRPTTSPSSPRTA